MCSKILSGVPTTSPLKCCVEVMGLKLIFGVPESYYTFCFLVFPPSGQVKPPSFNSHHVLGKRGTRKLNRCVEIIDCSDC